MRLSDLTGATADALRSAGAALLDLMTPTAAAGRHGAGALGQDRLHHRAGPQPRRRRPPAVLRRHGRGAHRARLPRAAARRQRAPLRLRGASGAISPSDPPQWPESTRRISQLRVTIEYTPATRPAARASASGRLHLDIVDYPGEWLIDLPLLELSSPSGRAEAVERRAGAAAPGAAKAWLRVPLRASMPTPRRPTSRWRCAGTALFTRYLQAPRAPTTPS